MENALLFKMLNFNHIHEFAAHKCQNMSNNALHCHKIQYSHYNIVKWLQFIKQHFSYCLEQAPHYLVAKFAAHPRIEWMTKNNVLQQLLKVQLKCTVDVNKTAVVSHF